LEHKKHDNFIHLFLFVNVYINEQKN